MEKDENASYQQFILFWTLPNDKILHCPRLEELADDKIHVTENMKFVSGRVENNIGQGENACYQAGVFTCLQYKPFENTVGKEEIACNE